MKTLIVTRHPNLPSYLKHHGIVPEDTESRTYVSSKDVAGKHIIGMLPLHLAAQATRYTEVPLRIPFDKRGQELTVEELTYYAQEPHTYEITEIMGDGE